MRTAHAQRCAALAVAPLRRSGRARTPFSVTAVLQEDPQVQPANAEERLKREAAEAQITRVLGPSINGQQRPPIRHLEYADAHHWYFSYGANMSFSTLHRRDVRVKQRYPCVVVDPSIKLVFQHRGGYSTLQALKRGEAPKYKPYLPHVHGVLYQVNKHDMRKLQKREGGYVLTDVEVETYDGCRTLAKTFVSSSLSLLHNEVTPTEKYMKVLREGAAEQFLDPLYQAFLSSIDTVPSVGLGQEYWDTPAKYIAYCFLCIVALVVVGFFSQQ